MGEQPEIDGVILTPLQIVPNSKGNIYHGMKKSDPGFLDFGEAYFSEVGHNVIKGWNRHRKMTLNLIVALGKVSFVIFDDREQSRTKGEVFKIQLSNDDTYCRLTVPPGVWLGFRGVGKNTNLILNIADIEHDPDEVVKRDLHEIPYDWSLS